MQELSRRMPNTPGNEQEVARESRKSGSLLLPRLRPHR